jgi:hypothetical protein
MRGDGMNKYLVKYSSDGRWVPFYVKSNSIYEVESWVHSNVQRVGICISLIEPLDEGSVDLW